MHVDLLSENRAELARFRPHKLGDHGRKELRFVLLLQTSNAGDPYTYSIGEDAKATNDDDLMAASCHTGITVLTHEICSICNTMYTILRDMYIGYQ